MEKRITFIGGGNMASAMVSGLLQSGYKASLVAISEPWEEARPRLAAAFPDVRCVPGNTDAFFHVSNDGSKVPSDIVILAVKPQVLKSVCTELSPLVLAHRPLVISIAAGIPLKSLDVWLSSSNADSKLRPSLVRVMPNTPALVGEGAAGLFASQDVGSEQRSWAEEILASVSKVSLWVPKETDLDAVTGVSGSGPAYFFLLVECLVEAGIAAGLDPQVASGLAAQTCLGAGKMLMAAQGQETPAELRKKVTSPNGTTEAGIKAMEAGGIRDILKAGVQAAIKRSEELGDILGKVHT